MTYIPWQTSQAVLTFFLLLSHFRKTPALIMGGKPRSQKTPPGCMIKHFKEGFVDGANYGFRFSPGRLKTL